MSQSHTSPSTIQEIDARVARQHLLQHPFYQAWSRGELRSMLSAITPPSITTTSPPSQRISPPCTRRPTTPGVRRQILSNLMDEEAGSPNHPELWLQFAESLGLKREEVKQTAKWNATKDLIETFRNCCGQRGTGVGLASLYAYESQIPAVSEKKIEGLKAFYGFTNPEGYNYFTVHIEADREHAAVEAAQIVQVVDDTQRPAALEAVGEVLAGLYGLLSAVCEKHGIVGCASASY